MKTYGPTGEGVKPKLGVTATMEDSLAKPGGAQGTVSASTDIPDFAGPGVSGGQKKGSSAKAAPDFAGPGGTQGWSHGSK